MSTLTEYTRQDLMESQPLRRLYFELGKTMYQQRRFEKAMEHLGEALEVKDDSVEDWRIYNVLYQVCLEMDQPTAAKENLLKVIATAPAPVAEAVIRSNVMEPVQLPVDAASDEKEKEKILLLQGEAEILKRNGKGKEAIQLLQQAVAMATQVDDKGVLNAVKLDLAELWINEDQLKNASNILHTIGDVGKGELGKRWQVLNGKFHLQMQNIETAVTIADAVLKEDAAYLPAELLKLQAYIVNRNYKDALAHVHHLMATHTLSPDLIFYKVEILLEGNINTGEGIKLLQQLHEKSGIDFIKRKIEEPNIRFRPQHGNDNFFLAQVYKTFIHHFSIEAAMEQADKALQENVHFDGYTYPHGAIYQLKAELLELQQNFTEAARFFYLSGKEYYWNALYGQANEMFAQSHRLQKEMGANPPLIDNYWYYADCLVQLSYTQTDPYVDAAVVTRAANVWYQAYLLQKPSYNDAWAYLTASLIHEQLAKLPDKQKQEELFYSWFYAEHNILIDNANPKAWGFISRAYRSNGLDRNAAALAQKAYSLDKKEVFIWEEKATTLLNLGQWEEADVFLQMLIENAPTEVIFKAYKGYALYHLAQFAEAQTVMNEAIEGRPDWMWARNLRLMVNWMLHNWEEVQKDAEWIWSKRHLPEFKNTTTHEFAYAAYFLEQDDVAVALFSIEKSDTYDEVISSLFFYCIYYALKNDEAHLKAYYEKYKKEARHVYNLTELKNAFKSLCPERVNFIADLQQAATGLAQKETSLLAELHQFAEGCTDCQVYGSIGWEAIQLSLFRLHLEQEDWHKAVDCCRQLQEATTVRVDKLHLWSRLYAALKEYFLNQPKLLLQRSVHTQMQAYANASPFNNIETLAELYLALSVTGNLPPTEKDQLQNKAVKIFEQAGVANVECRVKDWLNICAELLPEQIEPVAATTKAPERVAFCPQCSTEVISRSQKFCFACGAPL